MNAWRSLMVLLLVAGCGGTPQESADDKRDREYAEALEREAQRRIDNAQPLESYGLPATSAQALADAFTQAFNGGDVAAIEAMAHLQNVPEPLRETMLTMWLSSGSAGTGTITESRLRRPTPGEKERGTGEVVSIFEGTFQAGDQSSSGEIIAPVVEVDGHFYFDLSAP